MFGAGLEKLGEHDKKLGKFARDLELLSLASVRVGQLLPAGEPRADRGHHFAFGEYAVVLWFIESVAPAVIALRSTT